MELKSPIEVIALICTPMFRVHTGLWLLPSEIVGHELDEAVRLRIEAIDIRQSLLDSLPQGAHYTGLTEPKLLGLIDAIAQLSGRKDCALVYNVDLLLSRISYFERRRFWQDFFIGLPHRTQGVLIAVPETADEVLPPSDDLLDWSQAHRLAGTTN